MLLIGSHGCVPDYFQGCILNLSSFVEGVDRVNLLPPNNIGLFNDKDFDVMYANYIFSNDGPFCEFMKIIYQLYNGIDVFLLVNTDDSFEIYTESITKLIQQRYGYNYQILNKKSDYNRYDDSSFSLQGVYNVDQDMERFTMIQLSKLSDKELKEIAEGTPLY